MTVKEVNIKIHSSHNHQKWIIEASLPDWKDKLKYWNEATEITNIGETASNTAKQVYFKDDEGVELADYLKEYINALLTNIGAPIRAGERAIAWTLEYFPGGWQAIHNHGAPYKTITSVLCLEGEKGSGTFFAMLPDPEGTQTVVLIDQVPGTLIISEGDVWHGAYPCTVGKKVVVFDFVQEIL